MKRQFFAIGLAAASTIGGFAMSEPAEAQSIAAFEQPDSSSLRPMNLSSLVSTTEKAVEGGLSSNDTEDAYQIKLPAGKSVAICYKSKDKNNAFLQLGLSNAQFERREHRNLTPPQCSTGRRTIISRSALDSRSGLVDTFDVKFSLTPNSGQFLNGRSVVYDLIFKVQ